MAKITIDELTKSFDKTDVVKHVSLVIEDGEFFVFVGPSGSGKSTILRLIAGLISPTSGDIQFDGKSMKNHDPRQRNVAMVFQNYALYPHKNVYDNIAFGLRARKVPEKVVDERVRRAATMLGVDRLLTRWPKELSGGERQRVAIGRAIVRQPVVYLLDEPLSNLDARLRIEMRNEIAKLHSRLGTTFIYVTHDQTEAMTLGDRIAVLNGGKVEQTDTPADLYEFPGNKFVAGFIGSPPMNFVVGILCYHNDSQSIAFSLPQGSLPIEGRVPDSICVWSGRELILGVRPEGICLQESTECSILGRVERVEPIGHEGFVYLDVGSQHFVVRVQEWKRLLDVRTVGVRMHIDNVYFFSPENGSCIWSKGIMTGGDS